MSIHYSILLLFLYRLICYLLKTDVLDELIVGDIKLGFVMSKGQLEITVFEARNLKKLDPNCKGIFHLNNDM